MPFYAIIDHLCNNTSSKILLHGLSFTWKIILSFVRVVLLQMTVQHKRKMIQTGRSSSKATTPAYSRKLLNRGEIYGD